MTPLEALQKLLSMFPHFQTNWDDNIFQEDDGSFNFCGLFMEFGWFVRDNFVSMPEAKRYELFDFVESCLKSRDQPDDELDTCVCTCFLENLSNEPLQSNEMRRYMGQNSKDFFDYWNGEVV